MDDTRLATGLFLIILIIAALTAHAGAQDITETIVWDGDHPIKDSLATKSAAKASLTRANAIYSELQKLELPYKLSEGKTTITVKKIAYDEKRAVYGVWIEATRGGEEIATRSPVWVHNSPLAVVTSTQTDDVKNERTVTQKEDPLAAFKRVMLDYANIRPLGKASGDDSDIFYIGEDGGISGYASQAGPDQTYASMRSGSGNGYSSSGSIPIMPYIRTLATTEENKYYALYRGIFSFNTSGLPDDCTVDSATLSLYGASKSTGFGTTGYSYGITGGSLAAGNALANGDYDGFTDTEYSSRIAYADFAVSGNVNNFTLNSNGISAISKSGYTIFFFRDSWDIDNNCQAVWAANTGNYLRVYDHDDNAAYYPRLYVTYTTGGGSAPVAAFSANATSGYPPFDIAFTDSSTNTPTGWSWLFGDGEDDTDQSPTHTYDSWIGNTITKYSVNLSASNAFGSDWENKSEYITAFPLNASFTINETTGCAPLHVGFTDATNNGTPSAWSWNFGGDGTSSTQNPTHVFNTPGTYWVLLNASNSYSWDTENKTSLITVNAATVAAFSANETVGCPPLHVGFTDASTGTSLSNWTWDFDNDGNPDSYDQNPTAIFSGAGTYTVNLTVTGTCGADSEVKSNYITVSSDTVSADFSADDTTVVTGQTVTFTDLSAGGPTSWAWSWGDLTANGTTQNPTHAYATPGDYTVILTAVNGCGGSDTEEKAAYINVTSAPTPTPTPTVTPTGTGNVTEGNATYIYAPDQDYVPFPIWLAIVIVTIALFGHSLIFLKNSDLTAIMASLFAMLSAWLSNMIGYIDVQVTSYAEEIVISPVVQAVHPPWLVYTMLIFAFVSVVNIFAAIYKVYLKPVPWNEIYDRKLPKWGRRK